MARFMRRARGVVEMPWNAFVAAFLYYTLLAMLALGGTSARGSVVAGAYGAPVVAWGLTIAVRLVRAAWDRAASLASRPVITVPPGACAGCDC